MSLTDSKLRSLKPRERRYSKSDGNGLSINVMPTGRKSWTVAVRTDGKLTNIKIGSYPQMSLKSARARAEEVRDQANLGLKKSTVSNLIDEWLATYSKQWSSEKYRYTVIYRINLICDPFKHKAVADVTRSDIAAGIEKLVAAGKLESANRCYRLVNAVFEYAIIKEYIEKNPCTNIDKLIPSRDPVNMPSLQAEEMPDFWRNINKANMTNETRYAIMLFNYLAVRPSELCKAEWSEFNLEEGVWIIPSHRMKMRKEHLVPLARQPLEILNTLYETRTQDKYVFTSTRSPLKPMPTETPLAAIKRSGYTGMMVTHGFRSLFSTYANESQLWSYDVIERCLAHVPKNKIRATYNRAEYLSHRIELMKWYADVVEGWINSD